MNLMIDESLRAKIELLGICRLKLFRGNFFSNFEYMNMQSFAVLPFAALSVLFY